MEPATTPPRRRELAPGLRLRLRLLFKEELILPRSPPSPPSRRQRRAPRPRRNMFVGGWDEHPSRYGVVD